MEGSDILWTHFTSTMSPTLKSGNLSGLISYNLLISSFSICLSKYSLGKIGEGGMMGHIVFGSSHAANLGLLYLG